MVKVQSAARKRDRGSWSGLMPWRWRLWSEARSTVVAVLAIEAVALGMTILVMISPPAVLMHPVISWPSPSFSTPVLAFTMIVVAVVHQEISRVHDGMRRIISYEPGHAISFCSVWTFGAALVLPPVWAALVIVIVYQHAWFRAWRLGVHYYRSFLSMATVVVAAMVTGAVVTSLRPILESGGSIRGLGPGAAIVAEVVAGMLTFTVVQQFLVVTVVTIAARQDGGRKPPRLPVEEHLMEIATLCMGVMVAALLTWSPLLVVLVPAPLLIVARAALVRELNRAVERDGRTGLLTAEAWHAQAERLLTSRTPARRIWSSRRTPDPGAVLGVLMVDVDHFKRVNDTYGHAVGDRVLQQVAHTLRSAVRSADLVARCGGEEFLILLVDPGDRPGGVGHERRRARNDPRRVGGHDVLAMAERVRAQVAALPMAVVGLDGRPAELRVTVSIGAVDVGDLGPDRGADLQAALSAVVRAADSAVYVAKRSGRNRVHAGQAPGAAIALS